jgi:hypothetical protein
VTRARSRQPVMATSDPSGLTDHLSELLAQWSCAG